MRTLFTSLLFIFCSLSSSLTNLHAEESQPLEIDADSSDCGTDLENCTLNGNVVVRQGTAQITADTLFSRSQNEWELNGNIQIQDSGINISAGSAEILLADRQLKSFVLVGAPVNFRYLLGTDDRAQGKADRISFNLESRVITLDGSAQIVEAGNELNGEHIEYDIEAERLKANNQGKGDGRVHLIFEPPKKTEDNNSEESNTPGNSQQVPDSETQP